MGVMLLLLLSFSLLETGVGNATNEEIPERNMTRKFDYYKKHKAALHVNGTYDRDKEFEDVMHDYPGAYVDRTKSKAMKVEKLVLFLSWGVHDENNVGTPHGVNNMICHLERLGLAAVMYTNRNLVEVMSRKVLPSPSIRIMPFPDDLFWDELLRYKNYDAAVDPSKPPPSPIPSYAEHRDGLLLVSMMELLQRGYSVFHFDDDAIPIYDPIPFVAYTTEDIVTSVELRDCNLFNSATNFYYNRTVPHYKHPELNEGMTLLRPTEAVLRVLPKWIFYTVVLQRGNGQHGFAHVYHAFVRSYECDYRITVTNNSQEILFRNEPKICFLPAVLFQNGLVNLGRCGGLKSHVEYVMTMIQDLLSLRHMLFPGNALPPDFRIDQADAFEILSRDENKMINLLAPVTQHFNYNARSKPVLMKLVHMWVLNETMSDEVGRCNTFSAKTVRTLDVWNKEPLVPSLEIVKRLVKMRESDAQKKFPKKTDPYYYYASWNSPIDVLSHVFKFNWTLRAFQSYEVESYQALDYRIPRRDLNGQGGMIHFNATIRLRGGDVVVVKAEPLRLTQDMRIFSSHPFVA